MWKKQMGGKRILSYYLVKRLSVKNMFSGNIPDILAWLYGFLFEQMCFFFAVLILGARDEWQGAAFYHSFHSLMYYFWFQINCFIIFKIFPKLIYLQYTMCRSSYKIVFICICSSINYYLFICSKSNFHNYTHHSSSFNAKDTHKT